MRDERLNTRDISGLRRLLGICVVIFVITISPSGLLTGALMAFLVKQCAEPRVGKRIVMIALGAVSFLMMIILAHHVIESIVNPEPYHLQAEKEREILLFIVSTRKMILPTTSLWRPLTEPEGIRG